MDFKTAFLNSNLDKEVYIVQPEGFVLPENENKMCKLVKSLYGLKQAPKQWYENLKLFYFHMDLGQKMPTSAFILNSVTSME